VANAHRPDVRPAGEHGYLTKTVGPAVDAAAIGAVDVAALFVGAARVPAKERGRPLTLTSARAAR
jgi:hypothetical protein